MYITNNIRMKVIFGVLILLNIISIYYLFRYGYMQRVAKMVQQSQKPLCKDCHVLLISLDTLGAKHLPCYGYDRDTAPNLCAFAKENIFFEKAYAHSNDTLLSHVSIFTGLYPSNHQVLVPNADALSRNIPFLPEILQHHGYETVFYMPPNDDYLPIDLVYNRGITEINTDGYDSENYFDKAWKQLADNNKAGKKTFLFFHTYYVHDPYFIEDRPKLYTSEIFLDIPLKVKDVFYPHFTKAFYEFFVQELEIAMKQRQFGFRTESMKNVFNAIKDKPFDEAEIAFEKALESENISKDYFTSFYYTFFYFYRLDKEDFSQVEYLKSLYDQKIHELDETLLAKVIQAVNSSSFKDKLVVIITADHGEAFMEHGSLSHSTLHEEILKVPLIMYMPGKQAITVKDPVQSVDLFPTVLDFLGISSTYALDGVSLLPFLNSYTIFRENRNRLIIIDDKNKGGTQQKVFLKIPWKVFSLKEGDNYIPYELFNIENDPDEKNNVLTSNMNIATDIIQSYKRDYLRK